MQRIVVAIDPSGNSGNEEGDEVGIIVGSIDGRGHAFVLEDLGAPASRRMGA